MEYTARMNEHALVSRAAAAGSCVLLKNVENTLPFAGTKDEPVRVAVFGIGQIFTPTGLTGMEPWRKIGILDGLTAEPTVEARRASGAQIPRVGARAPGWKRTAARKSQHGGVRLHERRSHDRSGALGGALRPEAHKL